MIWTIKSLFKVLTPRQLREFLILQCFMLLSAAVELVGTVSIMPFIALAADPGLVESNSYFMRAHQWLGSPPHAEFLVITGLVFVGIILISNLIFLTTQFLMYRYSFRVGGELSSQLYGYYLSKDVLFHGRTNSADLTQRIMRDTLTLSGSLIGPALRVNSRIFSIALLAGLLVVIDPIVAFSTVLALGSVYWLIFKFVRAAIYRNGQTISRLGELRNRLLNESLGGIKDVKLYSSEPSFIHHYRTNTKQSDRASADNLILGETPFYAVEAVVFAGMVLLTLYLYDKESSLQQALPMLTLYCVTGLKIVPKVQQSYLAITRIRSAQPVFQRLYSDLLASKETAFHDSAEDEPIVPAKSIALKGVTFGFSSDVPPVFDDYSLVLESGKITAITGSSGVGKSTLLEILTGLIEPQTGYIEIDGVRLEPEDMASWRRTIGYAPQDVFLTDSSFGENIAFGVQPENIDLIRVENSAKIAGIDEYIESTPEGYATSIGEHGRLMSGGQRQRIGIARALYRGVSVLILDEATSALDMKTQNLVLDNIKSMRDKMTVVMVTHRAETLRIADRVVSLQAPQ